jgi:coniferyl-aldehyde dehydrogenase
MSRAFNGQKIAYRKNPMPTLEQRIENLQTLKSILLKNQDRFIAAINADFSSRSEDETLLAEIMPAIQGINYALKNLGGI